jgi:hypothetical protein
MIKNLLKIGLLLAVAPIAWSQTAAQDLTSIVEAPPKTVDRSHYNLFNPTPSDQMRDFAPDRPQTENPGEHQNWAIHVDAVEVFQGQPGFIRRNSLHESRFPSYGSHSLSDPD